MGVFPRLLRGGAGGPSALGVLFYAAMIHAAYRVTRFVTAVTSVPVLLVGIGHVAGLLSLAWLVWTLVPWLLVALGSVVIGALPTPPDPPRVRDSLRSGGEE